MSTHKLKPGQTHAGACHGGMGLSLYPGNPANNYFEKAAPPPSEDEFVRPEPADVVAEAGPSVDYERVAAAIEETRMLVDAVPELVAETLEAIRDEDVQPEEPAGDSPSPTQPKKRTKK